MTKTAMVGVLMVISRVRSGSLCAAYVFATYELAVAQAENLATDKVETERIVRTDAVDEFGRRVASFKVTWSEWAQTTMLINELAIGTAILPWTLDNDATVITGDVDNDGGV